MAAPITVNLFRDTLELVQRYNSSLTFKNSFERLLNNPRATYLGRPLKDYVTVMTRVTPEYKGIFQQGLTKEHITDLIQDFYFNKYGYQVLNKEYLDLKNGLVEKPTFLTEPEHQELVKKEEELVKAVKKEKEGSVTAVNKEVFAPPAVTNKAEAITERINNPAILTPQPLTGVNSSRRVNYEKPTTKKVPVAYTRGKVSDIANEIKQSPATRKIVYLADKAIKDAISQGAIMTDRFLKNHSRIVATLVGGATGYLVGAPFGPSVAAGGAMLGSGIGNVIGKGSDDRQNINMPYNPIARRLEQGTRSVASNLAKKAGSAVAKRALLGVAMNPVTFWIVVGAIVLILLILFLTFFPKLMEQYALFPAWKDTTINYCPGTGGVGGSCPTQADIDANKEDINSCHGLNPAIDIFNTSFSDSQINTYVEHYYQQSKLGLEEFTRRTRYIVSESQTAGLNPVIALGLWKTESLFSTVASASDLGCAPGYASQRGFENQVKCALGISAGGSSTARCATSKDPNSVACQTEQGRITSHQDIYAPYNIKIPIATFDDFAGMYGPFSPKLGDAAVNNNCVHTYNTMVEVASELNACQVKTNLASSGGSTNLAACKFTKGDQAPKEAAYQSPLLLSYFEEVAQKTGVPATVLAGIARVESTTDEYSISTYTDADVKAMEQFALSSISNYDQKISGSRKALCPQSPTGALGLMQIQPPGTTGHDSAAVSNGERYLGKTVGSLRKEDFCDPKTSIYLAAGFVLSKMQKLGNGDGSHWESAWNSDKKYFDQVASSYYGCLKYPSCQNGPNSYGDDLWTSFNSCTVPPKMATSNDSTNTNTSPTGVNPQVITTAPTTGPVTISCPLEGSQGSSANTITCGTADNPTGGCGHGGQGYGACSAPPYAVCPYSPQLKTAVDIQPGKGGNAPVYAPFVYGNQSVTWTKTDGPIAINGGGWGYKIILKAEFQGKTLTLDLTHINSNLNFDSMVNSGQQVGSVYPNTDGNGIGHLHAALAVDGKWQDSISETHICTGDAPPPPTSGGGTTGGGVNSCPVVNPQPVNDTAAQGDFFCQWDPKWASMDTGGSCSLASGGCGPTTTAMVLRRLGMVAIPTSDKWGSLTIPAELKGQPVNPPNIDRIFTSQKWRFCASAMSNVFGWLESLGYKVQDVGIKNGLLDLDSAQNFLSTEYVILASQDKYVSPNTGGIISHIFGVSGVDKANNQVRAFDPNNCNQDGTEGKNIYIPNLADRSWLYAKAIKK